MRAGGDLQGRLGSRWVTVAVGIDLGAHGAWPSFNRYPAFPTDEDSPFAGHQKPARARESAGICYLCGKALEKPRRSADHVPLKQFYGKSVLRENAVNLLTLPTHAGCNTAYQVDEEYVTAMLAPFASSQGLHRRLRHQGR
jgi:hypothetical protein